MTEPKEYLPILDSKALDGLKMRNNASPFDDDKALETLRDNSQELRGRVKGMIESITKGFD